jgi:hypothetical protein
MPEPKREGRRMPRSRLPHNDTPPGPCRHCRELPEYWFGTDDSFVIECQNEDRETRPRVIGVYFHARRLWWAGHELNTETTL